MTVDERAISTVERAIDLGGKMESVPFDYNRMKKILADWKSY